MKTKVTDFAEYLESFFTDYLAAEQGVSKHTIRSYRDTFVFLIDYMNENQNISINKLAMKDFSRDRIISFLNWLQDNRNNSVSTRNQRYAAVRSFFEFMERKDPTKLATWQSIRSIKSKKTPGALVSYLTVDAIRCLLEQIPTKTRNGRRNLTILSLLYESGARVQELVDLTPSSLRLEKPAFIRLHGKGDKTRVVPLMDQQVNLLTIYLEENYLNSTSQRDRPLFFNRSGSKLTCSGITYILKTYATMARVVHPELIPRQISPHILRHSKAMHLLQAGVNLVYIRDILGHVSIQSTEIYARADSKLKREALKEASPDIIDKEIGIPSWEKDNELKYFLQSLA
ncbi:MAG: site-specific integrase [Bacteroidales bacterium]